MLNKNAELFLNGLSQFMPLVEKVEKFEDDYNTSREKILSEELFWSEDRDEIYSAMREHDIASSDFIKGLKKELNELMALAATSLDYSSSDLINKEEK